MQNRISLDDVAAGGALARLKLVGELARIKAGLKDAGEGPLAAVKRLKLVARANQIRVALGAASQPKATPPAAGPNPAQVATTPEPPSGDDEPVAPRNQTAQYYEFDPNRKPAQRKKDNAAAMALLKRIDAGEVDAARLSPEEKLALAKYSGTGGALIGADGKKGSAYEYYTPKPIAEGIWDLMAELGFAGGKVLDPCAGVGIFGATAPLNAAIDAVELNETSGRINGLVNAGPGYTATVAPFERVAAATPDEQYDAVVTNVPFGGVADRGGNQLLDGRYQKEPLQNYFILRTLEKLKPGGLAVFITPPRCVSGKGGKEEELRVKASYMAEFLGAYRLPNSVFGTASADTMTDVIAFRKYGREALDKIAELREQSPKALIDANVQWQPFIEGRYFDGEGKRFILGEFVPKDPNKFRDVDRVTTDRPIAEIARMLKKFPGSRVDWDMLGTVETTPITYRDGDTITQAGQTLQMQVGRWVPMARGEDSASMAELVGKLTTPYAAFEGRIQWADAERCVDYMIETSQSLDIPDWLRGAMTEIRHLKDEGDRAQFWNAGIVGMAAAQVLQERLGEETGVNFAEEYPALTDAMQRVATTAKKRPAALGGKLRDGLVLIGNHYPKKTGLSAVWRGDVQQQAPTVEITADASFEGLRYKTKSAWVSLEDAKGIYGDGFDPYADPAWCLSPDGKSVTRADDYYVGNYAEFLRRVDADIASAASDDIRAKLLRQKLDAGARIDKVDVSKLTFNLFSPHVTLEEKAEFLRRFVHPSAAVIYDERTGEKRVDIDVPGSNLTDREKLLNRIGDYLKNGTITLGGVKLGMDDAKALQELRRMVNTANE
ncbi:SAM-dependent methyltransferase [Pseudomonas aeruginosa]|nr:SAM-dependent methyltransferase [Pseudomonas aeruginosa]